MQCEEVIVGEDYKARESARDITLPEAIVVVVNSEAVTASSCGSDDGEVRRVDAPAGAMGEADGNVETETVKAKVVDLEMGGGIRETEGEKLCRICHLCAEMVGSAAEGWELIEIGCVCKGELGMAHRHCAEAWFRAKGNRLCEICGDCAKNIVPKEDRGFMEVWHEGRRRSGFGNGRTLPGRNGYWTSQRFCSLVSFLR
ncbi:hypothetical protein HPP92_004028 [Vanilla planifolia]|uniref:RING-CH-type domain-containing protein n=1 Tax=Vanilla planifolia TaxID=51239 RepID=A0A835S9H2_VANPL|nr:hypothetical protein HPP92_004028 [Vanilla planifolia]